MVKKKWRIAFSLKILSINIFAYEIQFWETVADVIIVGGTLAEDVFTGGGGIADDGASFYLAYKLMLGL